MPSRVEGGLWRCHRDVFNSWQLDSPSSMTKWGGKKAERHCTHRKAESGKRRRAAEKENSECEAVQRAACSKPHTPKKIQKCRAPPPHLPSFFCFCPNNTITPQQEIQSGTLISPRTPTIPHAICPWRLHPGAHLCITVTMISSLHSSRTDYNSSSWLSAIIVVVDVVVVALPGRACGRLDERAAPKGAALVGAAEAKRRTCGSSSWSTVPDVRYGRLRQ